MVSLSSFSKVTEEGVLFSSPFTGEPTMLTPEESMRIQVRTIQAVSSHPIITHSRQLSRRPHEALDRGRHHDAIRRCSFIADNWTACRRGNVSRILTSPFSLLLSSTNPLLSIRYRSIRWLDRCIAYHNSSGRATKQNLFAIIQGGLNHDLRDRCLDEMTQRKENVPGYAIGGLSGGEEKDVFWKM